MPKVNGHIEEQSWDTILVSQVLPSDLSISYSRNYGTSVEFQQEPNDILESLILPNRHWACYSTNVTENSFEAESQILAEFNPHGGYNGLNNARLSAQQSPIYPGQESSNSNGSSYGCDLLNSQFDIEQVDDVINSRMAFQNEYSREETGQTPPDFSLTKSDGG